jgi:hypothetical protein
MTDTAAIEKALDALLTALIAHRKAKLPPPPGPLPFVIFADWDNTPPPTREESATDNIIKDPNRGRARTRHLETRRAAAPPRRPRPHARGLRAHLRVAPEQLRPSRDDSSTTAGTASAPPRRAACGCADTASKIG